MGSASQNEDLELAGPGRWHASIVDRAQVMVLAVGVDACASQRLSTRVSRTPASVRSSSSASETGRQSGSVPDPSPAQSDLDHDAARSLLDVSDHLDGAGEQRGIVEARQAMTGAQTPSRSRSAGM